MKHYFQVRFMQNPLTTTVDVSPEDLAYVKLKVRVQLLTEQLLLVRDQLQLQTDHAAEPNKGSVLSIIEHIDGLNLLEVPSLQTNYTFSVYVELKTKNYLYALQGRHAGECTGRTFTCMKCVAEDTLGISTISGCSKRAGEVVDAVFNEVATCGEAIRMLTMDAGPRPFTPEAKAEALKFLEIHSERLKSQA